MQVFEYQFRDLVYIDFGFVILLARLVASHRPTSWPLAGLTLARDYVAYLSIAVACAGGTSSAGAPAADMTRAMEG